VALTRFQRVAYRLFGARARHAVGKNPQLGSALQHAHMAVRPEVHLATAYLAAALAAAGALAGVALAALLRTAGSVSFPARLFILLVPSAVVVGALTHLLVLLVPAIRSINRARTINAKLPYAINYLSAMAAAGATPEQLFATLADQPLYGEVAEEASWVARDLRIMGHDIITALQNGIDRSPSDRFKDFLQGAVTSLTSGGDLKSYFASKAEQYLYENRQDQKKFLEGLGVLAESFVTVVVAAPLFLIVILSVMTSFGGKASDTLVIGYSLVFILIPLAQAAFGWTIKVMTPEV
jgi:flagellar protein FlaJ